MFRRCVYKKLVDVGRENFQEVPRMNQNCLKSSISAQPLKSVWKIPGYKILPLVGSRPSLFFDSKYDIKQKDKFIDYCFKRFGSIFRLGLPGTGNTVFIKNHKDVQKVFQNKAIDEHPIRPGFDSLIKLRMKLMPDIFKSAGMTFSVGSEWKAVRYEFNQMLLRRTDFEIEAALIDEVTNELIERIRRIRDPFTCEVPADFIQEIIRWSIEAVIYATIGDRQHDMSDDLKEGSPVHEIMKCSDAIMSNWEKTEYSIQWWRLFQTKELKTMASSMDSKMEHVLNMCYARMKKIDKEPSQAKGTIMEKAMLKDNLDNSAIISMLHDMIGAGCDVTPQHAVKVIYLLAKKKTEQQKLRDEASKVFGPIDSPVSYSGIAESSYLKAFIKETHRYLATATTTCRTVIEDLELQGYKIPKDWNVMLCLKAMGMDNGNVVKAEEFMPERFIGSNAFRPPQFSFLPYSFGKRQCLGRKISDLLLRNLAVRLVQNFDIEYNHANLDTYTRSVIKLKGPLNFTFKDRKQA